MRVLILLSLSALAFAEWPQWRGPARDGVAATPAPPVWPTKLDKRWEVMVSTGYSSPVASDTTAYLFGRPKDDAEEITAHDLGSGKVRWRHTYSAPFEMNAAATKMGKGPFATPLLHDGRLYAVGSSGIVTVLDAKSGKVVWTKQPLKVETKGNFCGAAGSPLIEGGMLILHLGDDKHARLMALDPATGAEKWSRDYDAPGYASPAVHELGGVRQLVAVTSKRVISVQPATGELLWQEPFPDEWIENIVTPVRHGNRIIMAGVRRGTIAIEPTLAGGKWSSKLAWENSEVTQYMSSPVIAGGVLYGFSNKRKGSLFAMDAATGKMLWSNGERLGDNASIFLAGLHVVAVTSDGMLAVFGQAKDEARLTGRQQLPEGAWAHPAVLPGGLLIRGARRLTFWAWK